MNYPFEKLEKLLHTFKGKTEKNIDNINSTLLMQEAIDEVIFCRYSFFRSVFTLKNERQLKLIIQTSQLTLIDLENRIVELYQPESSSYALSKLLLKEMDLLLDFLANNFSDCFDMCKAAPLHYLDAKQEKIKNYLALFKESLKIEKKDKAPWKPLFIEVEQVFRGMDKGNTSFHELLFLEHLFHVAVSLEIPFIETELYTVSEIYLLQQGYNNDVFIESLLRKMQKQALESNDQVVFWEQQKKVLLQLRKKSCMVYRNEHPDCIVALLQYTEAELLYLHKVANKMKIGDDAFSSPLENTEKIMLSMLPLNQFAVILRLLDDMGCLKLLNKSTFFDKIAKVTSLGNKERMNALSLKNKFYSLDKTAINKVRDLFHRCLKDLGRY